MGNNDVEGQYLEATADSTLRPSKASSLCEVEGQDSQRGMTTSRPRPVRGNDTDPPATLAFRTGLGFSLEVGGREIPQFSLLASQATADPLPSFSSSDPT